MQLVPNEHRISFYTKGFRTLGFIWLGVIAMLQISAPHTVQLLALCMSPLCVGLIIVAGKSGDGVIGDVVRYSFSQFFFNYLMWVIVVSIIWWHSLVRGDVLVLFICVQMLVVVAGAYRAWGAHAAWASRVVALEDGILAGYFDDLRIVFYGSQNKAKNAPSWMFELIGIASVGGVVASHYDYWRIGLIIFAAFLATYQAYLVGRTISLGLWARRAAVLRRK